MTPASGRGSGWQPWICGAAISLAILLLGLHALRIAGSLDLADLPLALAGAFVGALAADGLTGLVHWACDTWGDEKTPWLGASLIFAFREHHEKPRKMLDHGWTRVNREPGVAAAAALLLLSLPPVTGALDGHPFAYASLCSFCAFAAAANQLHQWAHMDRPPAPVELAQRCGLVLSPERHAAHHRPPNTTAYCISTGWLNPLLDRIGFWRELERIVEQKSGASARSERIGTGRLWET